jgi:hypothetical protein
MVGQQMTGFSVAELTKLGKLTAEQKSKYVDLFKTQQDLDKLWLEMGSSVTHLQRAFMQAFSTLFNAAEPTIEIVAKIIEGFSSLISKIGNGLAQFEGLSVVVKVLFGGALTIVTASMIAFTISVWKGVTGLVAMGSELGVLAAKAQAANGSLLQLVGTQLGLGASGAVGATGTVATVAKGGLFKKIIASVLGALSFGLIGGKAATAAPATSPIENVAQTALPAGANAGGQFQKGFIGFLTTNLGRALVGVFSAIAIGGIAINAIKNKRFTVADAAGTLAMLGPALMMFPPTATLGAIMTGVGLLAMVSAAIWPKFGAMGFGKGITEPTPNTTENNIAGFSGDAIDEEKLYRELQSEGNKRIFEAIAKNSENTTKILEATMKQDQKHQYEDLNVTWRNSTMDYHDSIRRKD